MISLRVQAGLVAVLCLLLFSRAVHAQESLATARELYAAAQYDDALKLLDRLAVGAPSKEERQAADLYRALCLLAVDRRQEAERTIEGMLMRDPWYRPGEDVSPRLRAAFGDARKRLLPSLVQQQYAEAKRAFDRDEFETAAAAFQRVLDALRDPDLGASATQPPLSDLQTLAAGFHDLSLKAIAPPPPPPAPPVPEPVVPPPPRVYLAEEAGIRPPVTVAQEMPRYPGLVPPGGIKGIVEVVINEQGTVDAATMVVPVGNPYDKMVLTAASRWRFTPALLNGSPVKFRKRIQIQVAPPPR